jgi:endonuclease/exonuclease/phosphatase family metal-dependent hydrolase
MNGPSKNNKGFRESNQISPITVTKMAYYIYKHSRTLISAIVISLTSLTVPGQPVGRKVENALSRSPGTDVRVMTWNIGSNSVFPDPGPRGRQRSDEGRPGRFRNVIRAVAPDVLCLQEVFEPRTPADAAALFDDIRPLGKGRKWFAHGEGDAVIVSRFPLAMKGGRSEDYGGGVPRPSAWALVDRPAGQPDIFAVCSHFQSRAEVQARQAHADMIVALIRDLRSGSRDTSIPKLTPMLVMGDFNAYLTDPMLHIATLLSGRIVDEKRFGPGAAPDWDDSPLRDALPVQNGVGTAIYTFGDGTGKPNPNSALDRILYTDSVLQMLGGFVLNTVTMSPKALKKNRLQKDDVMRRIGPDPFYDHLPVVVDLATRKFRPGRGIPK